MAARPARLGSATCRGCSSTPTATSWSRTRRTAVFARSYRRCSWSLHRAGAQVAIGRNAAGGVAGVAARLVVGDDRAAGVDLLPVPVEPRRSAAGGELDHHGPALDGAAAVIVGEVVLLLEDDRAGRERLIAHLVRPLGRRIGEDADVVEIVIGAGPARPDLD